MPDNIIFLSPTNYGAVKDALLKGKITGGGFGTKISAIKCLRARWAEENKPEKLGLREAKQAVENLMAELENTPPLWPDGWKLSRGLYPVTVRIGETAELSLDDWELMVLTEMGKIGLNEAGRILDLVTVIKAWREGKRVGVIGEPE